MSSHYTKLAKSEHSLKKLKRQSFSISETSFQLDTLERKDAGKDILQNLEVLPQTRDHLNQLLVCILMCFA